MKAKTELLLWQMYYLGSVAFRPTFRNLTDSFEAWAYRRGLQAHLRRLEAEGLVESMIDPATGKRLHRLTEGGMAAACGPRDPVAAWSVVWDGKWRLFLFDIPEAQAGKRRKLTRALLAAGCGCLQGSVWIAPMMSPGLERLMGEQETDCSRLLLLLADSKGEATDRKMVESAWDYKKVNRLYRDYLRTLEGFEKVRLRPSREGLATWSEVEHRAWKRAVVHDPMLPGAVVPPGYLGLEAAKKRLALQGAVARLAGSLSGAGGAAGN